MAISASMVRNRLVQEISPMLKERGFCGFKGNRIWRHGEKWVDVVDIQFIKPSGIHIGSPSLHIGRYFTFIPRDAISGAVKIAKGQVWPTPELCHFRKTIFKSLKQPKAKELNIWFVGSQGEFLEQCVNDIKHLTETQIIPWFDWLDDLDLVFRLLKDGKADMEGKDPDPVKRGTWNFTNFFSRHVIAGLVAFELQQWKSVMEQLAPVIEHGGIVGKNGQVFPLPQESMQRIETAYAYAARETARVAPISPRRAE